MNKISNLLKFNFEFKLHEIYDTNKFLFIQVICCINKMSNLAIVLNFNQSEDKLMKLRELKSRFIEKVKLLAGLFG
jgi:hypothetical protein